MTLFYSLDKLSEELRNSNYDFPMLAQSTLCEKSNGKFSKKIHKFLSQNGKSVVPYESIDSIGIY